MFLANSRSFVACPPSWTQDGSRCECSQLTLKYEVTFLSIPFSFELKNAVILIVASPWILLWFFHAPAQTAWPLHTHLDTALQANSQSPAPSVLTFPGGGTAAARTWRRFQRARGRVRLVEGGPATKESSDEQQAAKHTRPPSTEYLCTRAE
ncbi:hypothetical protein B0T10DRAFT_79429 [Thelonectria olida]|uniref:Uncharacterized protein n=1 Tax=Thelonectria olida TaxID=1576542 RepID=A0A9P9AND1_9HYPO|nr:hypothetical protein B0T10DRAFT_79429 [Thelonectria olida]